MAQKTTEGVTIVFLGTGAMDVDNATDLVEEFISATISSDDDPVRFVFPATVDEFSDTMEELVDMAKQSDITYEVVTSTADKSRRRFTEIAASAAKTYHVADVYTQLEHILTESPRSVLEVLWDEEREEELKKIVGKFVDAGIDVRDLTDGNVRMGEEDETEDESEPSAEPAEPSEAVTTTSVEVISDAEEVPIYSRSELEAIARKEGRGAIKDISLKLGLPARKASATMIEAILDLQGEPEEDAQTVEVETDDLVEVANEIGEVADAVMEIADTEHELVVAIQEFPGRLHDVLDEFLTNLGKTVEGLVFNVAPEEPMAVEPEPEQPRRRLVRAH
jgi:hypothetical protein